MASNESVRKLKIKITYAHLSAGYVLTPQRQARNNCAQCSATAFVAPCKVPSLRFCRHCSSLYRGDFEYCAIDGTPLIAIADGQDPLVGRPIERYRIEALLGAGSTGRVYRALHRTKEEFFAIKLIWGDLGADKRLTRRFQRAVQATQRIEHPNVVRIVDFATTSFGLSYLVMELASGASLRQILDTRGPLSPYDTATIGMQIASGLTAAHAAGFVHRDIKPANLVLEQSCPPRIKILDFGLVGLAVADADARITASGTFVGTPLYMAPEQARNASDVGPQADIYSLGVVLYELMTGHPPFEGANPLEVMIAHSTRHVPDLRSMGELGELIGWALHKDPLLRPNSAEEFMLAMRGAWSRLSPTKAPPACKKPAAETLDLVLPETTSITDGE